MFKLTNVNSGARICDFVVGADTRAANTEAYLIGVIESGDGFDCWAGRVPNVDEIGDSLTWTSSSSSSRRLNCVSRPVLSERIGIMAVAAARGDCNCAFKMLFRLSANFIHFHFFKYPI
jgi:hypothetical protein